MREWKACEVIVKQREKEMQSAIFAKLSSGSSIDSHVLRLVHRDSTLSNEVRKHNTLYQVVIYTSGLLQGLLQAYLLFQDISLYSVGCMSTVFC